jgi:membrane complex biogenesis BtpA family protein
MSALLELMKTGHKAMIGMVQLGPLPGSSRYRGGRIDDLMAPALEDAECLAKHGFDAVMVQNLGDLPVDKTVSRVQVAWMARIGAEVRHRCGVPVGVNFLENDADAMFAVASAAGADFVRIKIFVGAMVTPFGIEDGQAFAAQRARNAWNAEHVAIFADVHDRTGTPLASGGLAEDLGFAVKLGGADGVVLTGKDYAQTLEFARLGRDTLKGVPVLVGGGAAAGNIAEIASVADGAIVSSSLKDANNVFGRLAPPRVKEFMDTAKRLRAKPAG